MASLSTSNAYLKASTSSSVVSDEPSLYDVRPPQTILLKVKRVHLRWDEKKGKYIASDDVEETQEPAKEEEKEIYAFSIIRRFDTGRQGNLYQMGEEIQVDSPPFIRTAKEVMKGRRDIAWEAKPLKFRPEEFLTFAPQFNVQLQHLQSIPLKTTDQTEELEHLEVFVHFLDLEYRERLDELKSLIVGNQITFDDLWAVLVPGIELITRCKMTGLPWVLRLVSMEVVDKTDSEPRRWVLECEYIEVNKGGPGWATYQLTIRHFNGAKFITELAAYPFERADEKEKLTKTLISRGKRRWDLKDKTHKWYNDIAYSVPERGEFRMFFTKSRIILDGEMYDIYSSNGYAPALAQNLDHDVSGVESTRCLEDGDYLLMSPRLYGYALSDREWLIFSVDSIMDIRWSTAALDTLDMPLENKVFVQSLVAQHKARLHGQDEKQASGDETQVDQNVGIQRADDFVYGKGTGLLFNLHGPPGVGKTLTAEAISEVSKSPLYVVGSGELGTDAGELESALARVSRLATRWKAVVLIDEADVYLEKRDFNDMHRNAMVAVFLRKVEYYPGILFLTTNRVKVLDEAMKSRIDVSLSYAHPDIPTRERLWTIFLGNTDMATAERVRMAKEMRSLRRLSLNGREIKNLIKVASAFAKYDNRSLTVDDILRVVRFSQQSQGSYDFNTRFRGVTWLRRLHPLVICILAGAAVVLGSGLHAYITRRNVDDF